MLRELTPEVRAFLAEAKWPGVLSTLGPNGAPITSAVWFALVGDDIVISTPASRPKARNARLDARVSFIVDTKERPYKGVAIEGTAAVIDDPARQVEDAYAPRGSNHIVVLEVRGARLQPSLQRRDAKARQHADGDQRELPEAHGAANAGEQRVDAVQQTVGRERRTERQRERHHRQLQPEAVRHLRVVLQGIRGAHPASRAR